MEQQDSQGGTVPNEEENSEKRKSSLGWLWTVVQILGNLLPLIHGDHDPGDHYIGGLDP